MKALLQHPLRVVGRSFWLAAEFALAGFNFIRRAAVAPGRSELEMRAAWIQYHARRVLRVFGVDTSTCGDAPSTGLLVSNHLSYLDILVLSSLTPCVFVAKREVRSWPVFGWFAIRAGTVFVERERRSGARESNDAITSALAQGSLVVLFPEGTSSGGQSVLPFKSSLLEAAARQTCPLSAAYIEYGLDDGDVSEEVCYWKDMTLVPHLINLLGKGSIRAVVRFAPLRETSSDRKELTRRLHREVSRLGGFSEDPDDHLIPASRSFQTW
jgi:1-acyl-sn-glycerol-3-phosphate acyltransferase